jgi:hypothetical protein
VRTRERNDAIIGLEIGNDNTEGSYALILLNHNIFAQCSVTTIATTSNSSAVLLEIDFSNSLTICSKYSDNTCTRRSTSTVDAAHTYSLLSAMKLL